MNRNQAHASILDTLARRGKQAALGEVAGEEAQTDACERLATGIEHLSRGLAADRLGTNERTAIFPSPDAGIERFLGLLPTAVTAVALDTWLAQAHLGMILANAGIAPAVTDEDRRKLLEDIACEGAVLALGEGFFGMLERERVNRRRYRTRAEARADIFDYTAASAIHECALDSSSNKRRHQAGPACPGNRCLSQRGGT